MPSRRNETHVNHLPYMPFPPAWPVFIPKDRLANWFESHACAMELSVWTGTGLEQGRRNADDTAWEIALRRAYGTRRVVMATGVSAIPAMPELPRLDDGAGTVLHSGAFCPGHGWKGRRALVIGTGNAAPPPYRRRQDRPGPARGWGMACCGRRR